VQVNDKYCVVVVAEHAAQQLWLNDTSYAANVSEDVNTKCRWYSFQPPWSWFWAPQFTKLQTDRRQYHANSRS